MIHCHLRRERCVPVFLVAQVITSPYSDSIFLSFFLACLLACQSHQNLTSASANSVFRSSANKAKLDLPVRQKSGNASRRLQLYHEETQETSQEAQKRLKAERQRDASRRQYQTAEQKCSWLLDHSEAVMLAAMKMKREERRKQRYKSNYTTSNFANSQIHKFFNFENVRRR